MMEMPSSALAILNKEVVNCTRCPRLVAYREEIGREKRRAFRDHDYWARPVPGFGDPRARVLVMGLAPGAHGSNRTGRPFTGDASGKFMYPILYKAGFASQPNADHRDDGLKLFDCYITAAVRCAPPDNKPMLSELANCSGFLDRELVCCWVDGDDRCIGGWLDCEGFAATGVANHVVDLVVACP